MIERPRSFYIKEEKHRTWWGGSFWWIMEDMGTLQWPYSYETSFARAEREVKRLAQELIEKDIETEERLRRPRDTTSPRYNHQGDRIG